MICLSDNDIIHKLAACDLLDDALAALSLARTDVYVLPTAKYRFRIAQRNVAQAEQRYGAEVLARIRDFLASVREINFPGLPNRQQAEYYLAVLRKTAHTAHMSTATKTLKLPFLRLNRAKAEEFARLQTLNTAIANAILAMPQSTRRTLTSKSFAHVEMGSAWTNQTIRNANTRTKVKQFRCLPLETNNQNWTLHKVGETYSVSFGLRRGVKKRVPLAVHHAAHQRWLDAVLDGSASPGSIKLWCSRKGIWYACLSVSMDVSARLCRRRERSDLPDAEPTGRWIGIDRGQNVPLAAATPDGPVLFWKANRIRHVRRVYAARRKQLQAAGKHRAVKKLERRERRIVMHINHCLSKDVVALAQRCNAGIRLEDLSGIRAHARQRRSTKTDAGQNRDYWPFFQLEHCITYKALLAGVAVEKVPARYTSKSCHRCGALGHRKKHAFACPRCHYQAHADANAAQNIRDWYGMCCPLVLKAQADGAHGMPLNTVRKAAGC